MTDHNTKDIRNICLNGHMGCGKTSVAEALLFQCKTIDRLGRVEDGNTTSDYDPEETRRGCSVNTSILSFERDSMKLNLLDCPGNRDTCRLRQRQLTLPAPLCGQS